MKYIFLSFVFICNFTFSQTERKVGDFTKVTSFDQIEVHLIPSKENKVVLSGYNSEQAEVINKNGELKIRMPLTKLLKGDAIEAKVYFTSLNALEANEGSIINNDAKLKCSDLDIIVKEGSLINISVNTSKLTATVSSGGQVAIDGNAKIQEVIISTGGSYEAKNLDTDQTDVTVNAGGNAEVSATELVDAKVRAGGTIKIYGSPFEVKQKTFAGGRIEIIE